MARSQLLSRQLSATQGHPDSVLVFLAITACMATFLLCETLESNQPGAGISEAELMGNKQRSRESASELSMLIVMLSQLNHFEVRTLTARLQMHPLTPIPLLLSARFCLSHIGLDDSFNAAVPVLASTLRGLTDVNGLAQMFLRLLTELHVQSTL
ncbi:hypothetical protein ONZ43_g7664 [Nemania bipapillata]|uniref:Uncharacterized protein n=1 Tax=Nemania bipapillata TaxID=110536 RepID=A0ACC2HPF6_9PEZI|nr:hypothetical protein ONZ43_g7664 [Nemania bipapillata]